MSDDSVLCEQVRDMLRHLDDPDRLRGNELVARCLDRRPERATGKDLRVVVVRMIEDATASLPPRLREIIVRCDFACEVGRTVWRSLGICKRYFYRQRRLAMIRLGRAMLRGTGPIQLTVEVMDPIAVPLSQASALQAVGQLQQAVALIEQLARGAPDQVARTHLTTRLAYLYLELGDLKGAQECLAGARLQLTSMIANRGELDISSRELDVVEASISLVIGTRAAEAKTRRALVALRRLDVANRSERVTEALCRALFVATRLAIHRMAFGEAVATSLEACHVLDQCSTGLIALHIEALATLAYARSFVPGLLSLAIEDSSVALRLAEAHGLPRATARIASNACSMYVILGEHELAVRFGEAAVQVTRSLGLRDELAFCCVCLGAAYIAAGQARRALSLLTGVASSPAADQELAPLVQLLIVDSYIAEGRFDSALANVGQVITAFKRLSGVSAWVSRCVGSALRMKAEALVGLGDRAAARSCIHECLSLLNPVGRNFTLARALRTAARITGKQAYVNAAQELTQALRA